MWVACIVTFSFFASFSIWWWSYRESKLGFKTAVTLDFYSITYMYPIYAPVLNIMCGCVYLLHVSQMSNVMTSEMKGWREGGGLVVARANSSSLQCRLTGWPWRPAFSLVFNTTPSLFLRMTSVSVTISILCTVPVIQTSRLSRTISLHSDCTACVSAHRGDEAVTSGEPII